MNKTMATVVKFNTDTFILFVYTVCGKISPTVFA